MSARNIKVARQFTEPVRAQRRKEFYEVVRRVTQGHESPVKKTSNRVDTFTVLSKGILGLKTNEKGLSWSFGRNSPQASQEDYNACAVKLQAYVEPNRAFAPLGARSRQPLGKYHYAYAVPGEDWLVYERPFLLGSRLILELRGLVSDQPVLKANQTYYRCVQYRFMNLHSMAYVLTDLAALLLLRKGFAALHCSAFKKDGKTVVIFSPPNTGKTLTTMMACLQHGATFISEDLAITDGASVFGVPWTSSFRHYPHMDERWWARMVNRAVPLLELRSLVSSKHIADCLTERNICTRSVVTHLIVLERGTPSVNRQSRDEALRRVLNMNRALFNYPRSLINNAYEYFNPQLDISAAMDAERGIIEKLVSGVEGCLLVRTDHATDYVNQVLEALG